MKGAGVILVHMSVPTMPGDGHRRYLREIAHKEGAKLVEDFLDGVVPGHSYDGLHPDEEGQAMLAQRLLPVLRPPPSARAVNPGVRTPVAGHLASVATRPEDDAILFPRPNLRVTSGVGRLVLMAQARAVSEPVRAMPVLPDSPST